MISVESRSYSNGEACGGLLLSHLFAFLWICCNRGCSGLYLMVCPSVTDYLLDCRLDLLLIKPGALMLSLMGGVKNWRETGAFFFHYRAMSTWPGRTRE